MTELRRAQNREAAKLGDFRLKERRHGFGLFLGEAVGITLVVRIEENLQNHLAVVVGVVVLRQRHFVGVFGVVTRDRVEIGFDLYGASTVFGVGSNKVRCAPRQAKDGGGENSNRKFLHHDVLPNLRLATLIGLGVLELSIKDVEPGAGA